MKLKTGLKRTKTPFGACCLHPVTLKSTGPDRKRIFRKPLKKPMPRYRKNITKPRLPPAASHRKKSENTVLHSKEKNV